MPGYTCREIRRRNPALLQIHFTRREAARCDTSGSPVLQAVTAANSGEAPRTGPPEALVGHFEHSGPDGRLPLVSCAMPVVHGGIERLAGLVTAVVDRSHDECP
jgi:hypothetical protein